MRSTSTNHLILLCFSRFEREWLTVFVCAVVAALVVPLGDITSFRTDSPPARAAALTAPDGGSLCFVDANGGITTVAYQTLANGLDEVSVTDPLGKTVRQRKDVAGRVWSMVDADGNETVSTYDASGNVLTMRDANGVGWDSEYDALNRLVKRTDTTGAITRTAYDEQGGVTDITDAREQTVHITYDARGRKATVTERIDVPPTKFAYDEAGHLSTITDSENRVTTFVYDERGQLQSETYPAGQQTSAPGIADRRSYTYDDARRLLTRTDQAGVVTTYGYWRIKGQASSVLTTPISRDSPRP